MSSDCDTSLAPTRTYHKWGRLAEGPGIYRIQDVQALARATHQHKSFLTHSTTTNMREIELVDAGYEFSEISLSWKV